MTDQHNEEGFILMLVLVVVSILSIFALTMLLLSSVHMEDTGNRRAGRDATNIAYSRFQRAQRYIMTGCCVYNNMTPSDADCADGDVNLLDNDAATPDGILDFKDDLAKGEIVCEDITQADIDAATGDEKKMLMEMGRGRLVIRGYFPPILYDESSDSFYCDPTEKQYNVKEASPHYTVSATGELEGVTKTIAARIRQKSFLEYYRYVEDNLTIPAYTDVDGDLYVGGDLTFEGPSSVRGDVFVSGTITGDDEVVYKGEVVEDYEKSFMSESHIAAQVRSMKDSASLCGWVIDAGNRAVLDGSDNELDLSQLADTKTNAPTYRGTTVATPVTNPSAPGSPGRFNGIIFWDVADDLYVSGALPSDSEDNRSITIVTNRGDIYITDRLTANSPIAVGLVVSGDGNTVKIPPTADIFLEVDAAIMVEKGVWQRECPTGTTPGENCATPVKGQGVPPAPADLNGDYKISTPSDRPNNFPETAYDPLDVDVFVLTGPLITETAETNNSLGPWAWQNDKYETFIHWGIMGLEMNPPPFPKVLNQLEMVTYAEYED